MMTSPKTHITQLGKMTDSEVHTFQQQLPLFVEKMRMNGILPIGKCMTYKISTIEDMARIPDEHQASLQKDISLIAATFKIADKEKDSEMELAEIFPSIVFAPELGDNLALSTRKKLTIESGGHARQAAKAYDFLDGEIAKNSLKNRPPI